MDHPINPEVHPKSKTRQVLFWIVIGCFVSCLGAGTIAYQIVIGKPANDLEAAAHAYRKAGLPWVGNDLAPHPPVTPAENAAPLLSAAFRELKETGGWSYTSYSDTRKLLDAGKVAEAGAMLAPYSAALNKGVLASAKPRVDWHRNWDDGPMILFPEIASLKGLVQRIALRAQVEAVKGETQWALRDLRAARRVAVLADREPTIISCLSRIAMDAVTDDAIQRTAAAEAKEPEALRRLSEIADETRPPPDVARSIRGEAFYGVVLCRIRRCSSVG